MLLIETTGSENANQQDLVFTVEYIISTNTLFFFLLCYIIEYITYPMPSLLFLELLPLSPNDVTLEYT